MTNRFDLEQEILGCWTIVDDLKFYIKYSDEWTEDECMNYINGITVKYDKKFDVMFNTFEKLIKRTLL